MGAAFTFDREPDVDQLLAAHAAIRRRRRARGRRRRRTPVRLLAVVLLAALLLAAAAVADGVAKLDSPPVSDPTWAVPEPSVVVLAAAAVDAARLDGLRGGVLLGGGVTVAIGLTRTVALDGEQQYASAFRIDDLGAAVDPVALANVGQLVIQNGPGNSVASGFLDSWSGFGTIVQNSLDGQHIDTTTVLDIAIGNVASAIEGIAASQAVSETLAFQQ